MSTTSENRQFHVGYNGYVVIQMNGGLNAAVLQVLSANISKAVNVPTTNLYYTPFNSSDPIPKKEDASLGMKPVLSVLRLGKGTVTFSGQIQFEVNTKFITNILNNNFFASNSYFTVFMQDGQTYCKVENCVWSSFSFNCQANSLITASISFQSNNGYKENLQIFPSRSLESVYKDIKESNKSNDSNNPNGFEDFEDFDDTNDFEDFDAIPYWHADVQNLPFNEKNEESLITQFNINFQRNVTPVFLNNDYVTPTYLRPGIISVDVSVNYLLQTSETSSSVENEHGGATIQINDYLLITLTKAIMVGQTYNISNMNDVGEKSCSWTVIGTDATSFPFTISIPAKQ